MADPRGTEKHASDPPEIQPNTQNDLKDMMTAMMARMDRFQEELASLKNVNQKDSPDKVGKKGQCVPAEAEQRNSATGESSGAGKQDFAKGEEQ